MDEVKLEVELDRRHRARARLQETMRQQLGLRVRVVPIAPGVLPRHDRQVAPGGRRAHAEVGRVVSAQRADSRSRARPQARQIRGASEQVAVQIQHYVQEEGLGPGDFLGREEDLAAEFGVSRPTLREALKLLSSGNLIRATKGPGGGIFVAHTAEQGMGRSLSDAIAMMLETEAVSLHELLDARVLLEVPARRAGRLPAGRRDAGARCARRSTGPRSPRPTTPSCSPRLTPRSTGRSPRQPATG